MQEEEAVARPESEGSTERSAHRTWPRWLPSALLALSLLAAFAGSVIWLLDRPQPTGIEISLATPTPAGPAVVHVAGAVAEPGLYELTPGDRVARAIELAGGALPGAEIDSLNLAELVRDGQRIEVPLAGGNDAFAEEQPSNRSGGAAGISDGLVDLNYADQATLETLPNIGPARARAIIDWREEHGLFGTLDSLQDVPGIGPETVSGIPGLVIPG